ncbi:MAG TPA: hypothetical protein DEP84_31865, partial [Chloroflexi bacterium]|nr:hypothetical protein [Chloroflexota bacterium]
ARRKAPASALAVSRAVADYGNPYGDPAPAWERLNATADVRPGAEVLYFPDGHAAFREPQAAEATWQVLQHAGITATVLPHWIDAGETLLELGFLEQAHRQARHVVSALRECDTRVVLFSSGDTYHMVAEEYPETLGLSVEGLTLRHTSEFFADLVAAGRLRFKPLDARVTYHDPCRLGRGMGVYDAPRQVLSAIPGLTLTEPPWTRERAVCCGGGGGMPWTNPDLTAAAAENAAAMLALPQPDLIVTGSAHCKSHLASALPEGKVLELAELISGVL